MTRDGWLILGVALFVGWLLADKAYGCYRRRRGDWRWYDPDGE